MTDPADLDWAPNWDGGFYGLSIELGPKDVSRLEQTLRSVWRHASVQGCCAPEWHEDGPARVASHIAAELSLQALEEWGHLRGLVRLPSAQIVVCGVVAIRLDDGSDWLDFYIPLGALGKTDDRIAGFPFGDAGGPASLSWRLPIDAWLARVGSEVYEEVPFEFARIGFEASGEAFPGEEYFGRLVRGDTGLTYKQAVL